MSNHKPYVIDGGELQVGVAEHPGMPGLLRTVVTVRAVWQDRDEAALLAKVEADARKLADACAAKRKALGNEDRYKPNRRNVFGVPEQG